MIKRPMLFILFSFASGCMLAGTIPFNKHFLILSILFFCVLFLLFVQFITHKIQKQDYFLFILPILFYIGFIHTSNAFKEPALDPFFEQKINGKATGIIYQIADAKDYQILSLKDTEVLLDGQENPYSCNNIIVFAKPEPNLKIGNQIQVIGTLFKFQKPSNLGQFDEVLYYRARKIDYKLSAKTIQILDSNCNYLKEMIYQLKQKISLTYSKLLTKRNAGTIQAMLLGEKSDLDEEEKKIYNENGISHILAISGLHISLIGMYFFKVFRKLRASFLISSLLSGFFLYYYGVMTNFNISAKRAIFMLLLLFGGNIIGRTYDMLTAASLCAMILIIDSPLVIFDCGFLLSFGAVFGIGVIMPIMTLEEESTKDSILSKLMDVLRNNLLTSLSIHFFILPILLYFYFELPTYGVITNLIILPFAAVLLMCGFIGGLLGCAVPVAGIFMMGSVHYILEFYHLVCSIISKLPNSLLRFRQPKLWEILLYYLILTAILIFATIRKQKCYLILISVTILLFFPWNSKLLEITVIDVGQGDGILIQTPTGKNYLIDGGSSNIKKVGNYRLMPFLKAKGIRSIDYLLITHEDSDHVSGALELMHMNLSGEFQIKNLVLPQAGRLETGIIELEALAKSRNISVIYIKKGSQLIDQNVQIDCLHPMESYQGASINDRSLVLSLKYKEFSMLFTGDLEKEGERKLLAEGLGDYDILKVAHHGSKHSTDSKFLDCVRPKISIISCALYNSYGHPGKELLERLESYHSDIYLTSRHGSLTILTDGNYLQIIKYLSDKTTYHLNK